MMEERIWKKIAGMHTPGFFITAEMQRVGKEYPEGLEAFVYQKLASSGTESEAAGSCFRKGSGASISLSSQRTRWWTSDMP